MNHYLFRENFNKVRKLPRTFLSDNQLLGQNLKFPHSTGCLFGNFTAARSAKANLHESLWVHVWWPLQLPITLPFCRRGQSGQMSRGKNKRKVLLLLVNRIGCEFRIVCPRNWSHNNSLDFITVRCCTPSCFILFEMHWHLVSFELLL